MGEALTIPALHRAVETRDGQKLAGFYAADAVLRIIDQANAPSHAREIIGRDASAREHMIATLNSFRDTLEELPDGLGVVWGNAEFRRAL